MQKSKILNTTGYQTFTTNIDRAEGCFVYDKSGKKYLDMEAGVWALPLGHCDYDINKVMHEQLDSLSHCGYKYSQRIAEQCAGKLLDILSFEEGKCVFLSSGSEAVEYGVRLAKCVSDKKKIMCLKSQYFAAYGCGSLEQQSAWTIIDWDEKENMSIELYERMLQEEIDFSEIGVFLFEPGNSGGIVKFPPINLVIALNCICKKHDIIIVVDEVTTGVGRTGKWFGYMHYPICPEIVCIGKGLGNGYPVSAIVMTKEIAEKAVQVDFHYAQSHQNDSLGCRVAYEVLCKIEKNDMLKVVEQSADYLAKGYQQINKKIPVIAEIRNRGLLFCVELSADITESEMVTIEKELYENGVMVAVKPQQKVIRTYCPFIISNDMIDQYLETLESVLRLVLNR